MSEVRASGVASMVFADLPAFRRATDADARRLTARLSGKEGWCLLIGLVFLWQLVPGWCGAQQIPISVAVADGPGPVGFLCPSWAKGRFRRSSS